MTDMTDLLKRSNAMDNLTREMKTQLYNNYFTELEELLEDYHNEETKISVGNRIGLSQDGSRLKSLVLGVRGSSFASRRKDKTLNPHLTKHTHTEKGHRIYELCYTIISMVYPAFEFNSIIINFNSNFTMHKDSKNLHDDSVIFTLGQHTYGGLELFDDNKKLKDSIYIWKNPTKFSGKTTYHATEEFDGDRWAVVAYQIKAPYHYDPYEKELINLH